MLKLRRDLMLTVEKRFQRSALKVKNNHKTIMR